MCILFAWNFLFDSLWDVHIRSKYKCFLLYESLLMNWTPNGWLYCIWWFDITFQFVLCVIYAIDTQYTSKCNTFSSYLCRCVRVVCISQMSLVVDWFIHFWRFYFIQWFHFLEWDFSVFFYLIFDFVYYLNYSTSTL